jgi:hypothetical protein
MGTEVSKPDKRGNLMQHRSFVRHWSPLLALLAIGVIYTVVSAPLTLGPPGLLLGLIIALVIPLSLSLWHGRIRLTRTLAFVLLGLVTCAETVSTTILVVSLFTAQLRMNEVPHDTAIVLLRDGALIWLINILTFALWYWEIDGGGPARRHHEGYHSTDFVFPQLTLDRSTETSWCPHFLDYLFLAFTTSTAFSPTDTPVLSRRAKLLIMTQALISLAVLAILAARAINTL